MSELKYNELRKGNLLYFPFVNSNVEVIGINSLYGVNEPYFNKLSVMEGLNMYYEVIEVFKPIPLTEEWLVKFGFHYSDDDNEFLELELMHKIKLYADYSNGFSTAILRLKENRIELKYVHQLQNLYFALTGKELPNNNL